MYLPTYTGHVWSWGDGDFGKLGRGGSDCCKVPKVIGHFGNTKIVKVKCGTQFSVALSKDGKVYTWCVCDVCTYVCVHVCVCVCVCVYVCVYVYMYMYVCCTCV